MQEALLKVTHRDKEVEYAARTMLYRMMNLMGRNQKDALDDVDFMSVADVYRLRGMSAPDEAVGAFDLISPLSGAEFNGVRKDLRKFAIGLKEGKGDPFAAMHEISHMVQHGTFTDEQNALVLSAFREAQAKGETMARKVTEAWKNQADNDYKMSSEWFAESFSHYLAERTIKGDLFRVRAGEEPLQFKGQLETLFDRLREMVAYVVNGLIGRKDMRQMFRSLTFYGDMMQFGNKTRPFAAAVRSTPSYGVQPSIAKNYVRDVIGEMDANREILARQFVDAGTDERLADFVWYHGTPNGLAYERTPGIEARFDMASADAEFGPGVYVMKGRGLADYQSRAAHAGGLRNFINEAADTPAKRAAAEEMIPLIQRAQEDIAGLQAKIEGVDWHATTRRSADELMAEGAINAHSDAPAHTLASLQEKLIHAVSYEELLWRELNRAAGINRAPKVMPVFARARQTFNFDGDTLYSLGTREGNDITWFLVSLARANLIEPRAIPGIEDALGSSFTGTDLYQYLVRSAMVNDGTPNNVSEAKKALAEHLLLMDYDSLKVSQTQGDYGVGEAMVMLKPKNLKHIDADVYDRDVDHIFQSVVESDIKPVGAIASLSKTGFDPLDRSSIPLTLRILQRGGMPTHLAQPVRRMLRQEELSEDDLKILHRGGGFMTFLDELSVRVRRVGAQWFADKMKPLEGFGFYERQAADMSARVAPVLEELNALPDAGGRMKRWARRNAGLAFKDIPQPASHRRIIRALRRGEEEVLRLKPAERQAALNIAHAFESELREMRDLGIAVGDARAYGTD